MRTWQIRGDSPDPEILRRAAHLLVAGGIVVLPTETYYGIAADLRRRQALRRVQRLKDRDRDKPLLLLVDGVAAARTLAPESPPLLEVLAEMFWPGPLTLVLPAEPTLPEAVVSKSRGVAVRHSPHPLLAALLPLVGAPITGTSANLRGRPPARRAADLELGDEGVDAVLDAGPTPGGPPSTLLDLTHEPPRVLRAGAIAPAELERLL